MTHAQKHIQTHGCMYRLVCANVDTHSGRETRTEGTHIDYNRHLLDDVLDVHRYRRLNISYRITPDPSGGRLLSQIINAAQ